MSFGFVLTSILSAAMFAQDAVPKAEANAGVEEAETPEVVVVAQPVEGEAEPVAAKKEPKIIEIKEKTSTLFTSESATAKYSEYSGEWRSFKLDDIWLIRLKSETLQPCRLDFGPYLNSYDLSISAKVLGKQKGRLKPRFGVGLYGKYGFWFRLSGGSSQLELVQYGEVIASVPYQWQSEQWINLELRMKAEQGYWLLLGRAWLDGEDRPKEPLLIYKTTRDKLTHKLTGRGNLSASPYNGLPIYFDHVEVKKVEQWPSFKVVKEADE